MLCTELILDVLVDGRDSIDCFDNNEVVLFEVIVLEVTILEVTLLVGVVFTVGVTSLGAVFSGTVLGITNGVLSIDFKLSAAIDETDFSDSMKLVVSPDFCE